MIQHQDSLFLDKTEVNEDAVWIGMTNVLISLDMITYE
jgi:hypothetical protein